MKAFGVCSSNGQAGTNGVRPVGVPTGGECFRGGVASTLSVSANCIVVQASASAVLCLCWFLQGPKGYKARRC